MGWSGGRWSSGEGFSGLFRTKAPNGMAGDVAAALEWQRIERNAGEAGQVEEG